MTHQIQLYLEAGTGKIIASCRCGEFVGKRTSWEPKTLLHAYRQHLPWLRWEVK